MTTPRNLGVAVVGLGVGEAHARAYAAHPAARVVTLCDLDRAKAERVAQQHPGARVTTAFEDVLKDENVDVVSIASYDDAHHQQAVDAMRAGKHVFVEKPVCLTMPQLRDMKSTWQQAKGRVKLSSNMILRGAPLYRWIRGALADGTLGRPYAIDADYLYGRVEKITEGWRRDIADYSVMAGGGVHMVDLVLWIARKLPTRVHAVGNRIATAGTAFRYDDYTAAHLEFADGMLARISANFGAVQPHQHAFRVYGTNGTVLYDDAGARLHTSRARDARAQTLPQAPKPQDKGILIHEFLDAVVRDEDLTRHTQGIFDAMSVCLAIDRAKAAGAPTGVEYA